MKGFVVSVVRLYQKLAPSQLRRACLFEPCCSEYMIGAVEKNGVVFGMIKGVARVCRCRPPNGGIDLP